MRNPSMIGTHIVLKACQVEHSLSCIGRERTYIDFPEHNKVSLWISYLYR